MTESRIVFAPSAAIHSIVQARRLCLRNSQVSTILNQKTRGVPNPLGMQTRPILLIPRHPLGGSKNFHASSLGTTQERSLALGKALVRVLPLTASSRMLETFGITIVGLGTARKINPAVIDFSLRALEGALDSGDEIKVAVKCRFSV